MEVYGDGSELLGLVADLVYRSQKQKMDLTTTEPFSDTFGTKAQRKRPRLDVGSIAELANAASTQQATASAATASAEADTEQSRAPEEIQAEYEESQLNNVPRDYILSAGTSRRIWGELYKVGHRASFASLEQD